MRVLSSLKEEFELCGSLRFLCKDAFCCSVVWMVGLALGIYGAVIVSQSTWQHYQESPTVISMERDYKEWNTSFPAVTICPLEKYDNDSLNDLVEK